VAHDVGGAAELADSVVRTPERSDPALPVYIV
jgi:hypothetical protein